MTRGRLLRLKAGDLVIIRSNADVSMLGQDPEDIKRELRDTIETAVLVGQGNEEHANIVVAVIEGEPRIVKNRNQQPALS